MTPTCMRKLNVLILNGDLPVFPGWGGIEYLHTTNLTRLARKVGLVSLVHTHEQYEKQHALRAANVNLYVWEHPNASQPTSPSPPPLAPLQLSPWKQWKKRLGTLFRIGMRAGAGIWSNRPRDTAMRDLQFRNFSAALLRAVTEHSWQALIVIQSSCAHWLDAVPRTPVSVLVLHDVRALVYERQARTAPSWWRWLTCWHEAWRYRRFERAYCQRYDLVITVSPADELWVRQHYAPTRVVTIPIPVDSTYFAPLPEQREAPARILFTGMMNHPPNEDAALFFARDVFPRIQATHPAAEFWIVGRDPTPAVRALAQHPGIVVTGTVPDIRPYIAEATVVVVPLRFGAGMRQKILEAWALQKCVVSTRIGAEGLDYQDGVNILIVDDAHALTDRVGYALDDPPARDRLRAHGRALVLQHHHPDHLTQRYYQAIEEVWQEKRQRRTPMRVLVDLRWMRPGLAGGIENLSRSFVEHLRQLDHDNAYTLLVPGEVRYDFDLRGCPNIKVRPVDGPARAWHHLVRNVGQRLHRLGNLDYWRSQEVEALRRTNALDAEVALSIPGYLHLDVYPLANVLVVPDIQHEYHPEFFSPQALAERRRIYTESIKHADHLCAISEFTRQTLIDRLGIAPDRITTTHLAADPIFHPGSPARHNTRAVTDKYGLPVGEYLFFPGHTWPHKNHRTALRALRILREEYHLDPLLLCTGNPREAHPELLALLQELRLEERVRFLGYCPADELPALYEGAAALVFPSLFEGFGIPVLEAMWCDCPVICSNTTSLAEIGGTAALQVNPHSPEELAHAMSRVLTDAPLRQHLIAQGRQQAQRFSWTRFTTTVVRTLHQVRAHHFG